MKEKKYIKTKWNKLTVLFQQREKYFAVLEVINAKYCY
jgi:hypothetical protein